MEVRKIAKKTVSVIEPKQSLLVDYGVRYVDGTFKIKCVS